jgi:quercetin dioxygenase-like cupin family protein
MSYPPVRYTADAGEATAVVRPAPDEPDLLIGTTAVRFVATAAATGGEYGLYRWDMGASPGGARPHFHRTISEAFYVLDGAVELHDGRDWTTATAGDFAHVPPGGVHGFRNSSGGPASMLILFAPAAPREAYFEELARLAANGEQLSPVQWTELYRQHDQYMV